jgi:hypothetical protein
MVEKKVATVRPELTYGPVLPETAGWGETTFVCAVSGRVRMEICDESGQKIGFQDVVNGRLLRTAEGDYYVLPPEGKPIPWYQLRPFVPGRTLNRIENRIRGLGRKKKEGLKKAG